MLGIKKSKLAFSLFAALLLALPMPLLAAVALQRVESRFGCVAGAALTEGDILMMKSDGKCYKADADDSALRPAIGVAGFTAASAANVSVVTRGQVGGLSSLTKGSLVYLSTTAGGTTQTMPTAYSQPVGKAISATQYVIDIGRARQKQSVLLNAPDPGGADADLAAGFVLWSPPVNVTVTAAKHIPLADWIAAAAANDGEVKIVNAAVGNLATLSVVTNLASGTKNDMGTITNAAVVGGTNVTLTLTASGTANAPASVIQIEYIETGE